MTRLTKPVRREVAAEVQRRPTALVVTLTAAGVEFREKGRRTAYLLPYGVGYLKAAGMAADAIRRERKANRARRGGVSRGLLTTGR